MTMRRSTRLFWSRPRGRRTCSSISGASAMRSHWERSGLASGGPAGDIGADGKAVDASIGADGWRSKGSSDGDAVRASSSRTYSIAEPGAVAGDG